MKLERSLRLPHATALVVGTILGSAVFVQASEVTEHVLQIWAVLLVWCVAGVLSLFGALACAELASAFPRTGGVYVFLKQTYDPLVGFLWGWAMFWVMHSGIIAAMATVFGRYAGFFVPLGDRGIRTVAVCAILVLSALNYAGVKRGSTVQTLFTACKVIAVVAVVVIGFTFGSSLPSHFERGALTHDVVDAHGFLLAVIAGLFAFGGWHVVTYTAEETVHPERTIPKALTLGIVIVTSCYVALNAVYFYVLPMDRVLKSTRVAADAATALLGAPGGAAISGLVMFSVFGAMTGSILAAPRVYFAMARDGLLFRWMSELHPRFHTPHRAIVLQAIWASVLVSSGTYRQLFTRVIFTEWIFFALMAAGLFTLRKRPDYRPVYRVWGFPWVPGVFIAASTIIVINRMISEPIDSLVGLAIVAAGVPAYYLWVRPRRRSVAPIAAVCLACCAVDACGRSSTSPSIAQNVRIVFRGPTTRRVDLLASADACVSGVGMTHTHPSWRAFAAIPLTPIPPDRYEIVFDDVPIDARVSFRVNDQNSCDQNPTGAVTRNVFVNDVELRQNTTTPGNGEEPGFAFTISGSGRISQ